MMAMLQSKEECGKGPKKTCTPSAQKLYSMMCYSPNSSKEESLGVSSPKARLKKKEEKTTTENGSSSGQENKGKPQDKQAEKEKEKSSLTNAEFEEIIQIVLRKSLQECLGMAYKTSCAQPIRCTLLDKEPGIAASTDNDNADGERVMVPHILEISATQEAGVTSVIKTSKPGQPDPAPSEKKSNRPFLSKGKKGAQDEKMEKTQSGHEHRQKDQLKKTVQVDSQIRNQQRGKGGDFGQCLVWVQCSSPNCEKWRRLCGNIDPSVLPDDWSCDQNTDLKYNHCDIPEESWTGRESDVAYASYIPGSIIWAKQYGYPWWPGMVESDPDLGEYFLFASHLDSLPRVKARRRTRGHFLFQSKYHVTFFGETVSRAWIPVNMLKNFQELSLELAGVKKCRNKDCNQKLGAALMMAQEAEQISIQERVNLFGFRSRYNGSDSSEEGKDLMLSRANSPDSCLEKEEEESELEEEGLEEEEEEKKDPTLPSPKPARIQTKKPKARGLADGQDGTLQRKTLKRSLGNESAAPPVLIMGRKEGGHGKSEPDQPGPKKKFRAPQSKDSVISLSEDKEARMAPKGLTPPAHLGVCPVMGTEGWKCLQEAGSVPPDDEAFSDLDLEQILEDVGKEPEQLEEPQCGDDPGEFTLAFFEE
ncbi:zinc finger CW-type PWWP domain protein 1 isoform X4 [Canis lupus familiaris]|uniref:zinc finger CW-type PWWP domain protein 1 isoform X1 n=2 Tax=Canis lupus dingo TaxID=286419 RepID=UPI0015F12BBB|nr:zinc finger CW-type PWWP domain protein 1 isoform X1 [Canis lupus dingo]XP_038394598.1 zinc finger CW-type PWWP domain protein 1 isoform X4 [Canis lupus familiaris]XP_048967080.1 zinc finger CW-type PWWP domain protein 1 isoform X1 [Canis lupus dingo]XP_048967081.1 zinc finger CW-type PWWP domain protein 1 isoform X1 [Canis lupus dingo]XP_048967082.1 zinc finger CW-type PWWP domain protein 1 isoform X1 [Canis lupus dingo]XP_048967083.1 zinc finger CW-type PWWP domain protein 1 isoform X1 [C